MNLKDAILSTISEIQNHEESSTQETKPSEPFRINETTQTLTQTQDRPSHAQPHTSDQTSEIMEDQFLKDLRERILVLFEGFQSPNNANIEAKVDLTLNFLEHLLAKIDNKLEKK